MLRAFVFVRQGLYLWVGSADNVIAYNATRLLASTAAPPDISLSGLPAPPAAAALTNALGLAFTSMQDLWVNWNGTFALIESGDLQSGALTPHRSNHDGCRVPAARHRSG